MTIRPKLHFTARSGWINDPHGITVRDGRYHAFFQYVPDSTTWRADCRWGHSIGPDLLTMSERPVAIGPGDGDDGIWTGSLWPDPQGDPLGARIWYTSVRQPEIGIGRVREARPDTADWDRWSKGDVVLPAPPPELGVTAFRDPFVYRDGEDLFALLGAALPDGRAAALRYRIPAAGPWEYLGILAARSVRETEPVWMGALWECPQLVPLGDSRYALITSVWEDDVLHYAGCGIGAYADGVFNPEHWQRLTWGDTHYAPSAFRDSEDRWCLLFWMRDVGGPEDGWAGAHSVPYLIENGSDGIRLTMHPDVQEHRRAASSGTATPHADIEWVPTAPGSTLNALAGDTTIEVVAGQGSTTISVGKTPPVVLPGSGGVRVLIDGGAVEVSVGGLVFGAAIQGGQVTVTGDGDLRVWSLDRESVRRSSLEPSP